MRRSVHGLSIGKALAMAASSRAAYLAICRRSPAVSALVCVVIVVVKTIMHRQEKPSYNVVGCTGKHKLVLALYSIGVLQLPHSEHLKI
jgi:hypothetical protein